MRIEIFKKLYKVRKSSRRGKEVSFPAEVPIKPGESVIAYYDGFVLYVPKGAIVNEKLLIKAVKLNK